MARVSFVQLLLASVLAGCGGGTSEPNTPCNVYLECVNAVDRNAFEELRNRYGRGGSCFEDADEATCDALCREALVQLALANPEAQACDPDNIDPSDDDDESDSGGSSNAIPIHVAAGADILLVVDNSGSMDQEQALLAASVSELVEPLEARDMSYRIGITTTDNGNYWCRGSGISSPEAGNLVFSSCRERLADFVFAADDLDGMYACTDRCPAEWETIRPTETTVEDDATPRRRPWIDVEAGRSNLPAGLDTVTALQCLAPQGINGCGFESHLESMYKAFRRADDDREDEFGFFAEQRVAAVLFVTDEADCSFNPEWEAIFYPATDGGNQVFWSLPGEQQSPTSAVCWNAGVTCTPEGAGTYDDCSSADKDLQGNGSNADNAVLFPLSRYIEFVQGVENEKQQINPEAELVVGAITGVPGFYPNERIVYALGANAENPESFQAKFGVAEGCSSERGQAVPPVRLREFAEAFATGEDPELYSVCKPSYADALKVFADRINDQLRPSCLPACVADTDPVTELLEPNCRVFQRYRDDNGSEVQIDVPECEGSDLPVGTDVCHIALVDSFGETASELDDMSDACIDEGWNLEFRFVRREGVPIPSDAAMSAECQLSQNKAFDCPNLPG